MSPKPLWEMAPETTILPTVLQPWKKLYPADPSTIIQNVAVDQEMGWLYSSQAKRRSTGSGIDDLRINWHYLDRPSGSMLLPTGGHGIPLVVKRGWCFFTYTYVTLDRLKIIKRQLVRVPFKAGLQLDPEDMPAYHWGPEGFYLAGGTSDQGLIYRTVKGQSVYWAVDLNSAPAALGDPALSLPSLGQWFQGCAFQDGVLYRMVGDVNAKTVPFRLEGWSVATGEQVLNLDLNAVGMEGPGPIGGRRELEGLSIVKNGVYTYLVIGCAVGKKGSYHHDLWLYGPLR